MEETTFDIIRRHTREIPVDVAKMAQEIGLTVRYLALPPSISGKLVNLGGSPEEFEIQVNAAHGENRRRFTIAHEIAHYVLHRDMIAEAIVDNELYRSEQISSRYEAQANAYAADLLMPQELVQRVYEELVRLGGNEQWITYNMATRFRVSEQAMKIRLRTVVQLAFNFR